MIQGMWIDSLAVGHPLANIDQDLRGLQRLLRVMRGTAALCHLLVHRNLIVIIDIGSWLIQLGKSAGIDTNLERQISNISFPGEKVPWGIFPGELSLGKSTIF